MVCTDLRKDLRKVWTDVKGHKRQVLKCMDKKHTERGEKLEKEKKITQPLNLADFVRPPGYRKSQRRKKNKKPKKTEETLTSPGRGYFW